jgi:undecaprenyl-diphosphatase
MPIVDRRGSVVVAVTAGVLFFALLVAVAIEGAVPDHPDSAVVEAAHRAALHHASLRAAARAATSFGSPWVATSLAAVAVIGLWMGRLRREAAAVGTSRLLTQAATTVTKRAIARPRPHWAYPVAHASGYSFPSGHAAAAASVYLPIALVAWPYLRRQAYRWAVALSTVALSVTVAASRVLLGVHYPSDVLAGLALGVAVAAGTWRLIVTPPLA